jgi:hypothetical protein
VKKARDPLLRDLMLARSMVTRAKNARDKAIALADERIAAAEARAAQAEKEFAKAQAGKRPRKQRLQA